ncbi:MAG: hypothetical protein Q4A66_05155 [Eubacteriales bacterium]|nr:hypothetical protein [Eubacteriales bacterium]
MGFRRCFRYLLLLSIIVFPIGVALPRRWFRGDQALFLCRPFEQGGRIYERLRIQRWKSRLPDMSKCFPRLLPPKQLALRSKEQVQLLVQESCVAELVHGWLCLSGLYCLSLWEGLGGLCMFLANCAANLPFILVQRYNRPRFARLLARFERAD